MKRVARSVIPVALQLQYSAARNFSKVIGRKPIRKSVKARIEIAKSPENSWVSVKDEVSGRIYWWNQMTNETTALDAPKPTGPTAVAIPPHAGSTPAIPQQQTSMLGGIGEMVVQGMAVGTGMHLARHAVDSVLGGFGGGGQSGGGGGSDGASDSGMGSSLGDGDEWDI